MDEWEQEYRNLDNTRRTEIKKLNKERQYNEKNDKKEKEDEKTEKKEKTIEKRPILRNALPRNQERPSQPHNEWAKSTGR